MFELCGSFAAFYIAPETEREWREFSWKIWCGITEWTLMGWSLIHFIFGFRELYTFLKINMNNNCVNKNMNTTTTTETPRERESKTKEKNKTTKNFTPSSQYQLFNTDRILLKKVGAFSFYHSSVPY